MYLIITFLLIRASRDNVHHTCLRTRVPSHEAEALLLPGVCFWREGREERNWVEFRGEKGGAEERGAGRNSEGRLYAGQMHFRRKRATCRGKSAQHVLYMALSDFQNRFTKYIHARGTAHARVSRSTHAAVDSLRGVFGITNGPVTIKISRAEEKFRGCAMC